MPRYYFDFDEDGITHSDDTGIELDDDRSAELQASIAITDMAREHIPGDGPKHTITVTVRRDEIELFTSTVHYQRRSVR